MSRLTLVEGLLQNLVSEIDPSRREFIAREEALARLKSLTGQDFGYDVKRWREWFRSHPM